LEKIAKMAANGKIREKPNLSIIAIISFTCSFIIARAFTSLNPSAVLISGGYHIHHFWFGIALLAIGGWLGISYSSERTDRLGAILFGAGGGLIGDEVGLLLTLENYWAEVTYTFVILVITFASMIVLVSRYQKAIRTEFTEFARTNASLYISVFIAAVSIAFILETDNSTIMIVSSVFAIIACITILAYFIQRIRRTRQK
jgi:preprotein translocase subunit YajC